MASKPQTEAAIAEAARLYATGLKLKEIAERMGVQRPCITRRLQKAGILPPPKKTGLGGRLRLYVSTAADNDDTPPPIVSRDPCPRCAVRADIGCRHRPSNGITSWVL